MSSPSPLDEKTRSDLVEEARRMGVERPERMTRVELRDEIVRRSVPEAEQAEARGLFGVARSMLASVVETGLNLPDAAKLIRGDSSFEAPISSQTPVATVTLAEIYAAQGHRSRALRVLEDVLRDEPGHEEALRVQAELLGASDQPAAPERQREALTVDAPPVAEARRSPAPYVDAATPDYIPGGFLETTGEEIETGRAPDVVPVDEVSHESRADAVADSESGADSEPVPASAPHAPTAVPVLVLAQSSRGLTLYWELPEASLDECSVDTSEGRAAMRIVAFSPTGTAPSRDEKTVGLAETTGVSSIEGCQAGKVTLDQFGEPAAVRAALGWETEDGFLPLAVGRPLEEWGADRAARAIVDRAAAHLS